MDIILLIILFLIIDTIIFGIIFFLFQLYYTTKIKNMVNNLVLSLTQLTTEKENKFNIIRYDAEMKDFYDCIEGIYGYLQKKEKDRLEILKIVNSVAANMELCDLLDDLMPKFIETTNSSCGAFYLANPATAKLELKASVGFSKNIYADFDLTIGEGFVGVCAQTKEVKIIKDIPDDTIYMMRTFLGVIKPKSIMVIPITSREELVGVLLLASVFEYTSEQNEVINLIKYYVGIAIGNGLTYERTKRLTNELKFQNSLIQNLNDELEQKVQNRTVFLNNIIDSIKDYAIYAMDKNAIVTAWNKGAELILGYKKEEIVGKHIDTIYPEENMATEKIKRRIELAINNGRYEESGWRYKKDGSSYYCEMILFTMYDEANNLIGFTNVTKDITYLKNVERALVYEKEFTQKMFDSSTQALIMTNEFGVIESANKMAEKVLGEARLVGVDICDFFLDSDYLRKNLTDVAQRYGRGEWAGTTREGRVKLWFNVNVLMDNAGSNHKLYICLLK